MAGLTASASVYLLQPARVGSLFEGSEAEKWTLVVLGWFSVLNALHSAAVCAPAEAAAFRAMDGAEMGSLSR